jgi:hypothetical protein
MSNESIKCDLNDLNDLNDLDINNLNEDDKIKMKIKELIDIMVINIDIVMIKIDKNIHEIEDFEKIKALIDNINDFIKNNNINKENYQIIKIFEKINDREIKNEELIKIAISIYKKNFLNIFKSNETRINILNNNFYDFIFNKIKKEDLTNRYRQKLINLFLD